MLTMIARRVGGMLASPSDEWRAIAASDGGWSLTAIYAAIMLIMPPVILTAMGLAGINFQRFPADSIFTIGAVGLAATTTLLFVLAAAVRWIVPAFDGASSYVRALVFLVYATTPMWLAAAIGNLFVPVQRVTALIGFVWTVFLIGKGAMPMFNIGPTKRGVFTYTTALSLIILWLVVLGFTTGFMMALARR